MTGTLRSTARNPVAIALMGLLILVFLILGVGGGGRFPDAFRGARSDAVVSAGGHAMTATEYRRVFEQQKTAFEQQSKQPVTTEFLVANGFDQQLLKEIGLDQAQSEVLTRIGVVPDHSLIDAQIKQIPVAFDRVTGKFSESQFEQFLASQGLTPRQVEEDLTDELAQRHYVTAMAAAFKAPRAFAALNAIAAMQNRDVSYFVLDARAVVQPAPPTDAQLTAFMKAHAAQLTRPEMRVITLARFSASDLAPTVTVSAADIQKEFDFRKDSLSSPETRTIIQIPVKTAAQGQQAAQRLSRGEDPVAIAKSFGVEPVIYADKPRSAVADSKIAAAAFALKEGQVSGPVQGDLGLSALKVTKITPAKVATLESAQPKIEADLKIKSAQKKAYDLSQKFDDARQGGANVADAAKKTGVTVTTVGPFTADGKDGEGKPIPLITDKIAKSAFGMRAGEDSEIQDAGPGEYYALRLEKVVAPSLPAIDEVRGPLTQAYVRDQLIQALRAKAESLMADLRHGKSMDEIAKSVGAQVVRQQGLQVIKAQQYQALGREFLSAIFSQKPNEVFAAGAPNGVFIARLDAIRPADVQTTARFLETVRQRASQDYLRDLANSAKVATQRAVKVNVNLNLARQTMGVDPTTLASSGSKSDGGAK
jgi:peptidyl-prolyl cis-trans isomerase D